jgi:aryl-alcohol dehydrogenase-like predicted oxidoreductase
MAKKTQGMHPLFDSVEMGIGTWQWGDRMIWGYQQEYHETDLQEAFNASLEAGIRFFDTAEVYGQGQSERILGKLAKNQRDSLIIATKFFPFPWRLNVKSLLLALQNSLKRLNVEQVDLYQIHQPLPPVKVETWMEGLSAAVEAGLTQAVGVSNYNTDLMHRAYNRLKSCGVSLASNQVEYSLINRAPEKSGLLKMCQDLGVALIAYSPLGMGMLTGKYTPENPPKGFRGSRYNRQFLLKIQPLINRLKQFGEAHNMKTRAEVALNWVICKGAIPIPGAKTGNQVMLNAGALGWRLSDDEIAELDEMSDRVMSSQS